MSVSILICAGVSTPSVITSMPSALAMPITDSSMTRLRGLLSISRSRLMSIFSTSAYHLNADEGEVIDKYRALTPKERACVAQVIDTLLDE